MANNDIFGPNGSKALFLDQAFGKNYLDVRKVAEEIEAVKATAARIEDIIRASTASLDVGNSVEVAAGHREAAGEYADLSRLYAVSDDDAAIPGALLETDRGARYWSQRTESYGADLLNTTGLATTQALTYRDEALGFRNEAETFRDQAQEAANDKPAAFVGLGVTISTLSIPVGTDTIQTSGYSARGDHGAARYIAIDEPHADWAWPQARERWMIETANGRWFMLDPSQAISPEMFGAVGDAEHRPGTLTTSPYYSEDITIWKTDAYTGPGGVGLPTDDWRAIRAMTDYATFIGRGIVINNRPGAIYAFLEPRKSVGGSTTKFQVRRYDMLLVECLEHYDDGISTGDPKWNPTLSGVNGLVWNFNGSKLVQMPYHIPEAGHVSGDPRWHARGLFAYKCQNVRLNGYQIDMNWRKHTSWSGRGFQRNDWGLNLNACRNWLCDGGWIHDSPHDGIYLNHRWESGVGGMAGLLDADLTNQPTTDTEWTDQVPVPKVYWPHGECENIVFRNFDVSNSARQAMSIIGGRRIFILGGRWSGTQQYLGTAPLNTVGEGGHGLAAYRLPRLSPGCWIDAEPNREHPKGVEFVTVIGARVYDNFSTWGATGQGEFTRVENSFLPAAVDVANNTITIVNTLLPTAIIGQKVRLYNVGGSLPAGVKRYTDYWINRPYKSSTFTLHISKADAIAGTNPVIIGDQGSGTHYIAVHRAKSQVNNVRIIDCELDHPAWGGDFFPGETTRLYINGGTLFNRSRSRTTIQDRGRYQNEIEINGVEIRTYEGVVNSDDSGITRTVTIDHANNTVSGTDLRLEPYGFTRVRFYSTSVLPQPLLSNRDYFATHVTNDQCLLSVSPEAARAGIYIDLTDGGDGEFSMHRQTGFVNVRNSRVICTVPDGFEFDCIDGVDLATNSIVFPDLHEFSHLGEDSITLRAYPGASLPAPLVGGTTYYPIVVDETRIKLATSPLNAKAGIAIDLTDFGTGWARVAYNNRGQLINQRGTWDNVEFFIDRRSYPVGASSTDAFIFRRSGELRNLHFRTDLPQGEGIMYVDFIDCPQALIDSITFMANGTIQMKNHTALRVSYDRPRQVFRRWWETDLNQIFNPRTDGAGAALNVEINSDRVFQLLTTGAFEGQEVTIYRTINATGAFNFSGHGAVLASPGQGARFEFHAGAWVYMGAA